MDFLWILQKATRIHSIAIKWKKNSMTVVWAWVVVLQLLGVNVLMWKRLVERFLNGPPMSLNFLRERDPPIFLCNQKYTDSDVRNVKPCSAKSSHLIQTSPSRSCSSMAVRKTRSRKKRSRIPLKFFLMYLLLKPKARWYSFFSGVFPHLWPSCLPFLIMYSRIERKTMYVQWHFDWPQFLSSDVRKCNRRCLNSNTRALFTLRLKVRLVQFKQLNHLLSRVERVVAFVLLWNSLKRLWWGWFSIFLTCSRTREFRACFATECGNQCIRKSMSTSFNIDCSTPDSWFASRPTTSPRSIMFDNFFMRRTCFDLLGRRNFFHLALPLGRSRQRVAQFYHDLNLDLVRSCLMKLESFLHKKLDVDPMHCNLMFQPCFMHEMCMTRCIHSSRSYHKSSWFWSMGSTSKKNTVCLLLKSWPPNINPLLTKDWRLNAHPI